MTPIQWIAHYDTEIFPQFNEDGTENKYADIDRNRLTAFSLVRDGNIIARIHLSPDKRLIYRRRVEKRPGLEDVRLSLAGWQKTVNGENIQSIVCVFDHMSTVEVIDGWRDGWFDKPEFLDFE
jgi:hypothetical protein